MKELIEDGKVVSATGATIWLQYSQIFNEFVTTLISICTLIYVGKRAIISISETIRYFKNLRKKK